MLNLMKTGWVIFVALISVTIASPAYAVINVPGDYPTIQEGLDNAASGEMVLVQPGVYGEQVWFGLAKDYDLIGVDRDTTIIDSSVHGYPAITVGTYYSVHISNLTIRDSRTNGIHSERATPNQLTISNCVIKNNAGYGIYFKTKFNFTIENCEITGNAKRGIYVYQSKGIIDENNIAQNNGGIFADYYSELQINKNTIEYNIADDSSDNQGSAIMTGLIWKIDIQNNIIQFNESDSDYVISMAVDGKPNYFINNFIYHNSSKGVYGTINFPGIIVNNTIVGNYSTLGAGGIYLRSGGFIINNIIFNNSNYGFMGEFSEAKNNNFYGNFPAEVFAGKEYSDMDELNRDFVTAEGNISCDPGFIVVDDYHLSDTSCCIDTGTSDNAPPTDLEGDTRPMGAGYDIGADEHYVHPISLKVNMFVLMVLMGLLLYFGIATIMGEVEHEKNDGTHLGGGMSF